MSQIQSILDDEKTSALVIAPVDAYGLKNDAQNRPMRNPFLVISDDQLIMDTDKINYYVTFDTRKAGKMVGEFLSSKKRTWRKPEKKNAR